MSATASTRPRSATAASTPLDPLAQANRNMRLYQINEQKRYIDGMCQIYQHGQAKLMVLRAKLGRMGFNLLTNDFVEGYRVGPGTMRMYRIMRRLRWELHWYGKDIQEHVVRWKDTRLAFEEEDLATSMNPLARRMKLLALGDVDDDEEEEEEE